MGCRAPAKSGSQPSYSPHHHRLPLGRSAAATFPAPRSPPDPTQGPLFWLSSGAGRMPRSSCAGSAPPSRCPCPQRAVPFCHLHQGHPPGSPCGWQLLSGSGRALFSLHCALFPGWGRATCGCHGPLHSSCPAMRLCAWGRGDKGTDSAPFLGVGCFFIAPLPPMQGHRKRGNTLCPPDTKTGNQPHDALKIPRFSPVLPASFAPILPGGLKKKKAKNPFS